ncbi:MAG: hypothetical protein IH616_19280 [Gemmatimonadales bacterium]|nr:hypothetical protein [Gemmatimonadales bacterium]
MNGRLSGGLESIDTLKRRAEETAQYVDRSPLAISPQCGFASTMGGNPVTGYDERSKLRLCVEAARTIWGVGEQRRGPERRAGRVR